MRSKNAVNNDAKKAKWGLGKFHRILLLKSNDGYAEKTAKSLFLLGREPIVRVADQPIHANENGK